MLLIWTYDNDDELGKCFKSMKRKLKRRRKIWTLLTRSNLLSEKFDYSDAFDLKEIVDTFEDLETATISQDMIEDRVKKWPRQSCSE